MWLNDVFIVLGAFPYVCSSASAAGAQTYVYLAQKVRRDGKVVNVVEMHLGTQDEVARRLTDPDARTEGSEFLP